MTADTSRVPLWVIVLLATMMPLGMHLMVPVFPLIARDLRTSDAAVQTTLTVYIAGIALAQLAYGPISDRFGRVRPLRVGLALQVVGSVIAASAPTVGILVAGRAIQGVGACAGLVLGRAMLRDIYPVTRTITMFAYIATALGVMAALSPLVGAYLSSWFHWRVPLAFSAAYGVVLVALSFRLDETHGGRADLVGPLGMLRDLIHLLRLHDFSGSMIGFALPGMAFFAYVTVAPSLAHDVLAMTPDQFSLYYSSIPIGFMAGSFAASKVLPRFGPDRVCIVALAVNIPLALAFLSVVLVQGLTVFWLFFPMAAINLAQSFAVPALMSRAVSADPKLIGSAAGLLGFCQMTIAGLGTQSIGILGGGSVALAGMTLVTMMIALVGGYIGLRRRGT